MFVAPEFRLGWEPEMRIAVTIGIRPGELAQGTMIAISILLASVSLLDWRPDRHARHCRDRFVAGCDPLGRDGVEAALPPTSQ